MDIKAALQTYLPRSGFRNVARLYIATEARKAGLMMRWRGDIIDIINRDRVIRIDLNHFRYSLDIIAHFDYYYSAVRDYPHGDKRFVDYSHPMFHDIDGFDLHPILLPSLSEPISTTRQYLDFAALSEGMTVFDLGAYSGLTSIMFQEAVGATGHVIAVDADEKNLECIARNFALYEKAKFVKIELLRGAVWKDDKGIEFSSEGNMGASATSIVGARRGSNRKAPSFTLSGIAEKFRADRVDFVKCDVEGVESVIFGDVAFFARFLPRTIIETHVVHGKNTKDKCVSDLSQFGYTFTEIPQPGGAFPLIAGYPPSKLHG